jgi:hypothetical protein
MENPMSDPRWDDRPNRPPTQFAGELVADYRERLQRQQAEAVEQRARELAEQTSTLNTPSDRIRIWERRHGLPLPTDPSHRLLQVVATGTGLTLDAVRAEQRQRRAQPPVIPTVSIPVVATEPMLGTGAPEA